MNLILAAPQARRKFEGLAPRPTEFPIQMSGLQPPATYCETSPPGRVRAGSCPSGREAFGRGWGTQGVRSMAAGALPKGPWEPPPVPSVRTGGSSQKLIKWYPCLKIFIK